MAEKATVHFEPPPGRRGQVDWATFKKPGRKRVQGLVLTLGSSRASYLDFSEIQALPAFFGLSRARPRLPRRRARRDSLRPDQDGHNGS